MHGREQSSRDENQPGSVSAAVGGLQSWPGVAAGFLLIVAMSGMLFADAKTVLLPRSGSLIQVSGTSTLHNWVVSTSSLNGQMAVDGQGSDLVPLLTERPLPISVVVQIPAKSLKSGKDSMDETMYQSLKADDFPTITYRLTAQRFTGRHNDMLTFDTDGILAVAGAEAKVHMPVDVIVSGEKGMLLTVKGRLALRMSDFKIPPPVALLGTIRSGDDISIGIVWELQKQ